jgi:ERAP1-like C-terminal domain
MMGKTNDPAIAAKAYDLFMATRNDPIQSAISGDLRATIYRCALRHDEFSVYQSLKSMYESTSFPEEQRDCLDVMGCVQDPKLHQDMLDYVFHSGHVRSQDIATPLSSLALASVYGGRATWEYFQHHYEMLRQRYINGPIWSVCVGLCSAGMSGTFAEAQEVEQYFQIPGREPGPATKRLYQTLEVLKTKVLRRERDRTIVTAYFQNR